MPKAKEKVESLPKEKLIEHLDIVLQDIKIKMQRAEKLQNSVKKIQEFEALSRLLNDYDAIKAMIYSCRCLLR